MLTNVQYNISWYNAALALKAHSMLAGQLDEPYGFPGDHQPDATML